MKSVSFIAPSLSLAITTPFLRAKSNNTHKYTCTHTHTHFILALRRLVDH